MTPHPAMYVGILSFHPHKLKSETTSHHTAFAMYFSDSEDENLQPVAIRRKRFVRERINFNVDDFRERFRLSRHQADYVLTRIGDLLQTSRQKNHALAPKEVFLVALRFFATGGFYRLTGDAHGVSDATVCRSVKKVVDAINERLFHQTIRWPEGHRLQSASRNTKCYFRMFVFIRKNRPCAESQLFDFYRSSYLARDAHHSSSLV